MATSVTSVVKHFPSAENGFTTTTSGSVASGAATVGLNSVAGYSNGEVAVFVIDPTDAAKKQAFTGTIDTAGVQVTGVVWTAGTNQTHDLGATVVDYATATHISMVTKGLLVNHGQAGNHHLLSDANGNELVKFTETASAVNEITVANAATGNSPTISATGGDTNPDLKLSGKGTGRVKTDHMYPQTAEDEGHFDYVVPNTGVWSGDSYGSTLAASMTAIVCYINGRRISIDAVTARAFTASKDVYIDVLDNADGTGTLVYTDNTINAASPTLAPNSLRIGIIVTGASSIAAAASINQGQEDRVLPIASSIPYAVTDSLGNLICPRDPNHSTLGYRQIAGNHNTGGIVTNQQIVGLTCPVIVPTGRKVDIEVYAGNVTTGGGSIDTMSIWDGTSGSGTLLNTNTQKFTDSTYTLAYIVKAQTTPATASKTYNASISASAQTAQVNAASTAPAYIRVKLA
jgi:hypothetical protein